MDGPQFRGENMILLRKRQVKKRNADTQIKVREDMIKRDSLGIFDHKVIQDEIDFLRLKFKISVA